MNEKLCKRLRRQARIETVGMPARRIIAAEQCAYDSNGKAYRTYAAKNAPASTRGVYLRLKQQMARSGGL